MERECFSSVKSPKGKETMRLLIVLACIHAHALSEEIGDKDPKAEVTATVVDSKLVVTNQSSEDVYYFICEKDGLKVVEWAPDCTDYNRIAAKKSVSVPANQKSFEPTHIAVVLWWHKGNRVDEIREFEISIE
jgi:hypothetical protein